MRRGVLAGVKTAAAVVAQVRQLHEVGVGERALGEHRGEDRAVAFAVSAGVADFRLAARLGNRVT